MEEVPALNFLEEIIENDLKSGKHQQISTRFPPEPNGYLHIGHATSICLNFGLARKYGGTCNLRFDDTNPITEETQYVESIKNDVKWLGFEWDALHFTSDYFDTLYGYALDLIRKGKAYVDDSTAEEIAALKGNIGVPGQDSPYRNRSVEENLRLFEAMKAGKYPDGEKVLRAKIDMAHPNLLLRDPILYRIKHEQHHRTGDTWCIYPMYDFAHGQSDSIEKISHSFCTLEFIHHRPLYDWLIEQLEIYPSRQYEFARRNINYTVMSKRKLLQLVKDGDVEGWDDPRMPTISGLRRRGYTPESIRNFVNTIGVAKRENRVDVALLEFSVRDHLNKIAQRRMAVLEPLRVEISNYPEGQLEMLKAENNPEDPESGHREVPFSRELWIEREDFMEEPPKKFFRLGPGLKVRLKYAYIIECEEVLKDASGKVTGIRCRYFPESKSGEDTSGLKVKGTIHWVEATTAKKAELRLYDRLFSVEDPDAGPGDFKDYLNPDSLNVIAEAYIEPELEHAGPDSRYQFLRKGYFALDKDSTPGALVFNRTVSLKDGWAKITQKG